MVIINLLSHMKINFNMRGQVPKMKRVYCLYRVSTLGQVDQNDIPMQRIDCRKFAEQQGWTIVKEFTEKGVSGFKVAAEDRDAIQEIKTDAIMGKFDVLLVFMFDRLGRRDDETPFVVEWFVRNGIEVWSTKEGEQRFDSHVDKLTNYIRYWQASGESIKTSMRTKARLGQIVEEGHYKGGTCPYGYNLVRRGRFNKKNHELYELEINEFEAAIVQTIFHKNVNEGLGIQRIATYLNDSGIKTRSGGNWCASSVRGIIHQLFDKLSSIPEREVISQKYQVTVKTIQLNLNKAKTDYAKHTKELTDYKAEVIKVIRGESNFTADLLNTLIAGTQEKFNESEKTIATLQNELEDSKYMLTNIKSQYNKVISWSEVFDEADIEAKMIVSSLIKKVLVRRGYDVEIEFYIDFEQFSIGMDKKEAI